MPVTGELMARHPNLVNQKVVDDTWFLAYVFCCGIGFGPILDEPKIAADSKMLCVHGIANTTDLVNEDGFCGTLQVMCCVTQQFQLPPLPGAPKCICFNTVLAEGDGEISKESSLFNYNSIFDDTFWIVYAFCGGIGLSGIRSGGRPLIAADSKMLIMKAQARFEEPIKDGIFAEGATICFCLRQYIQLPPKDPNPLCGLCGWRLKKQEEARSLPSQIEMK